MHGDFTAIESSGYCVLDSPGSGSICIAISLPHCGRRISFLISSYDICFTVTEYSFR